MGFSFSYYLDINEYLFCFILSVFNHDLNHKESRKS